jgi:hypothetical protein
MTLRPNGDDPSHVAASATEWIDSKAEAERRTIHSENSEDIAPVVVEPEAVPPTDCVADAPPVSCEVERDVNQAAETEEYQEAVEVAPAANAVAVAVVAVVDAVDWLVKSAEEAAALETRSSSRSAARESVDVGDAVSVTRSSKGRTPLR